MAYSSHAGISSIETLGRYRVRLAMGHYAHMDLTPDVYDYSNSGSDVGYAISHYEVIR